MAPHKPRKTTPIEYTTDDEDMILYDVEEDEFKPNPADKYATKYSTIDSSTQTDENITKIVCPLLELLQPTSSLSKQDISASVPTVSTSSSTQAHLLPSTSTISESQPPIPAFNTGVPLYLADRAIVKKSRKQLLPKYTETITPRLQFSKSNIPSHVVAIAVQNLKRPLTPRKKATY
ncbi:hypothetical protein TNCV_4101041 [Trichonephila clavipes]|nr:hypothetical protein TNCV_4101041 [Trichonephila clavipes]